MTRDPVLKGNFWLAEYVDLKRHPTVSFLLSIQHVLSKGQTFKSPLCMKWEEQSNLFILPLSTLRLAVTKSVWKVLVLIQNI